MNFEIHTFVLFWLSNKTVKRLLSGFAGIIGLIQTLTVPAPPGTVLYPWPPKEEV